MIEHLIPLLVPLLVSGKSRLWYMNNLRYFFLTYRGSKFQISSLKKDRKKNYVTSYTKKEKNMETMGLY